MSPEKRSKTLKNSNTDENLPFDIYDSGEYTTRMIDDRKDSFYASKLAVHVTSSSDNNTPRTAPNEYDEDDEEDFIKIYFASGTVLKPSDEPYDLRSKIHQANRELENDDKSLFVNAPGKVKFDNTVMVLDSFEDIGTISIGTEKLHGAVDVCPDRDDGSPPPAPRDREDILAEVNLSRRNDEDDQNDVVCRNATAANCSSGEGGGGGDYGTLLPETDTDDRPAYSTSASFSRSFSSESDDPSFINVIESGDEFKTIMNRNNRRTCQGSAIDEQVTYFPELFTHTQYKLYENSGKTLDGDGDGANIYVPKKLDADELRNKLREISKGRKNVQQQHMTAANNNKPCRPQDKSTKKPVNAGWSAQRKVKPTAVRACEKKTTIRAVRQQQQQSACKPRTTYYFELDPKGKLKPLNKNEETGDPNGNPRPATKFFHINLKAGSTNRNDENVKPRITRTPNADLFLEFQTDKAGNKGAKLVIKKKPTAELGADDHRCVGLKKPAGAGTERARLPGYNGLRSEYGLSAEQLLERRKIRMERERRRKEFKQRKHEEEQKKRAENEKNFYKWLQQKKQLKKQPKTGRHSYPMNRLTASSARASVNSIHNNNRRKASFALEELLKINDENSGSWFKF